MMPARGRSGRGRSPGEELAMPRAWIRVAVVALVVLSVGTLAFRPASAQEATPTARTGHPLVGAWILDRDMTHPTNPLATDRGHGRWPVPRRGVWRENRGRGVGGDRSPHCGRDAPRPPVRRGRAVCRPGRDPGHRRGGRGRAELHRPLHAGGRGPGRHPLRGVWGDDGAGQSASRSSRWANRWARWPSWRAPWAPHPRRSSSLRVAEEFATSDRRRRGQVWRCSGGGRFEGE